MEQTTRTADVVVVGLGLIGAAAARHLAGTGADVVGVGPAEPQEWAAHRGVFASHYDSGRITRKLDARLEWAVLAVRAIAQYPVVAAEGGLEFHVPSGTVFASADAEHIARLDRVGRQVGADHRILGGPRTGTADGLPTTLDGRVQVPGGLLAAPAGTTVIAEPGPAGFLDPRRMLVAQLAAARARRATLVRDEVVAVEPHGTGWRVRTSAGGTISAPRVVLATGAHTDELAIAHGAFVGRVRPETVVLATLAPDERDRLAAIPSVLSHLDGGSFADLYQVPPTDYPDGTVKLKLGATLRHWSPLATGDDRRAWMQGETHRWWLDELRGLVEDLVPGIRAEAWDTKPCMITDTAAGLPTVDHLAPGLVVAAGGNGYAAKSADALGALAAGLVLAGRWVDPDLDAAAFRLPPT